jgi:hypothetical protein
MQVTDDNLGFLWPWETEKFTPAQDLAAGKAWIQKIYNTLKPNVSFAVFETALRRGTANNPTPLSDAEYAAWLQSKGYAVNLQPETPQKVLESMAKAFAANKNMLPTRMSIDSAFLNPNVIKWTYWDATKMTASQTASQAKEIASDVGTVLSTTGSFLGFIIKYKTPIIYTLAGGLAYFIYKNRAEVMSRIKEKGYKVAGLGK